MTELQPIIDNFQVQGEVVSCSPMGNGNINDTFLIHTENEGKRYSYTLQSINTYVFTDPDALMDNISLVTDYLKRKIIKDGGDPTRETLSIVKTKSNSNFYVDSSKKVWRIYNFINNSVTYDTIDNPIILENAAKAYGRFQKHLSDFPVELIKITLPDFHNTKITFKKFIDAVNSDPKGRTANCADEIAYIKEHENYFNLLMDMLERGEIRQRVVHNDTKFNNILIDEQTGEGLCAIDLDTVMLGLCANDFGDAVRYAANTASEDETDLSKVSLNLALFESFCRGFLPEIKDNIDRAELENMHNAVMVITLELATRFLTDYINGDVYFKTRHPAHNYERACCQLKLARDIEQKLDKMYDIVKKYI